MKKKKCSKCDKTKSLEEFNFMKDRNAYRAECRKCSNAMCRAYKAQNREKIATYNKSYKKEHAAEISVYNNKYNKENREAIQTRQTKQHRERRKTDPNFATTKKLRSKLYDYIKNKGNLSKKNKEFMEELIGCEWDCLELWFLYQFDDKMKLNNYGKYWCVDHVNPCCNFDLTDEENQYTCFHWSNLRPTIVLTNLQKTGKVIPTEINNQVNCAKKYIKLMHEFKDNYREIPE